ncbi:tRNA-binding protein [Mucilaginibacter sp. 3215]
MSISNPLLKIEARAAFGEEGETYFFTFAPMETITWHDFEKVELRVGTVLEAIDFPEARKPAFKVRVDFGEFGVRWSSAQITKHYTKEELVGRQIVGVVNFPKKQIANFMSEFLVTGFADENGDIVLTAVEKPVPNGSKLI